jgi:hypothetical protein
MDRVAENLSTMLMRTGAGKVEVAIPDKPVKVAIEDGLIYDAFAVFSNAVARGAMVTILGDLLRIETGEEDENKGCAVLSVSVSGGHMLAAKAIRDALSAVQGAIKNQSGSLRFWEGHGEVRLNLYLPVVYSN